MSTERNLTNHDKGPVEKIQQRPAVPAAVDIYENADELLVIADLPGVTQEDLSVRVEKGELTLEGRRKDAGESGVPPTEVPDFRRSFVVPQGIDGGKIAAELKDGILRVHLPKSAALKPRQIPVTTG